MSGTSGDGPSPVVLHTDDAEGTRSVAAAIAGLCGPGDVLLLAGDLGAGKTTFAQGFGRALGIEEPVTSPTFTLVRQYAVGTGAEEVPVPTAGPVTTARSITTAGPVTTLFHADVYRLDHLAEVVDLGLGELVEDGGVALVEWGDVAEPVLGRGALVVRLVAGATDEPDDGRTITVTTTAPAPGRGAGAGPASPVSRGMAQPAHGWGSRWPSLVAVLRPWVAA